MKNKKSYLELEQRIVRHANELIQLLPYRTDGVSPPNGTNNIMHTDASNTQVGLVSTPFATNNKKKKTKVSNGGDTSYMKPPGPSSDTDTDYTP